MKVLVLVLLCVLPTGAAVSAEIYRWVDAGGGVHFSQDPPSDRPYQRVTPQLAPATPAPHVESLRKAQRSAEDAESESNKTRSAGLKLKAETLERCAKARERLSYLQEKTAHRLFKTGPDGQPARYTDEEFNAEIKKAQGEADQTCT
ncbi:MAG: DUF4124 domain-containing protein [Nevskia sp.]